MAEKENAAQSKAPQIMKLIESRTLNVLFAGSVDTDGKMQSAYNKESFVISPNGWFEDNLFSMAFSGADKPYIALTPIGEGDQVLTAEVETIETNTIKIRTHVDGAKAPAAFDIVVYDELNATRGDTGEQKAAAASGETAVEITGKGQFNWPGVLWTGLISSSGTVTKYYSNNKFSLTYEQISDTSLYWLKYVNSNGSQDLAVSATISKNSDDGYGWTANVISVDKANNRIKIRTMRDNAKMASAFFLTINGSN